MALSTDEEEFLRIAREVWSSRPDLMDSFDIESTAGLFEFWYWVMWHGLDPKMNDRADDLLASLPRIPPRHLTGRVIGELTPSAEFLRSGLVNWRRFVGLIDEHLGLDELRGRRVLDFGAGCGRIARNFLPLADEFEFHLCDVDAEAMRWLQETCPWMSTRPSGHIPPLDFEDAFFDIVYAYSVFSHLTPMRALDWVSELARVTKPGGLAILTTQGPNIIELYRLGKREYPFPAYPVIEAALPRFESEGYLYFPYRTLDLNLAENREHFATWDLEDYGALFLDERRVRKDWTRYFDVLAYLPAPDCYQDFWVLRRI